MTAAAARDPETLERLLAQREAELLDARLLIEKLKLELLRARRDKYGASSERLGQLAQLELLVEELETERERIEPPSQEGNAPPADDRPRTPRRQALPEHLPRETRLHQPENVQRCQCDGCDGVLRLLGEDVSEVLDLVPARFKVVRHVRPKYSCAKCQAIVQAPAASRPIARGLAGPGLLAHVLTSKFADHRVPRARPP